MLRMQFVQFSGLLGDSSNGIEDACRPCESWYSSSCGSYSSHQQQHALLQELLQPPPQLLVCTRRGLLLVNVGSGEVERCCLFGVVASRVQDVLRAAEETRGDRDSSSHR